MEPEEPDCSGTKNIICLSCWAVIEHRCECSRERITRCLCGDPDILRTEPNKPEAKGAIEVLWSVFGGVTNAKGYRELDPHIGLIYGDSITPERQREILERLEAKGYASTNVVLGIGSYTYQHVTRDTYGQAMKATYGEVNGEGLAIFKTPKTDDGVKNSAKGLLAVFKHPGTGEVYLKEDCDWAWEQSGLLETVFEDGNLSKRQTLAEIRGRVASNL